MATHFVGGGSATAMCSPELQSATAGPIHYDPSIPTVSNATGVGFHYLSGLAQSLGTNACAGGPRYMLSPNRRA